MADRPGNDAQYGIVDEVPVVAWGISATEDGPVFNVPAGLLAELQQHHRANLAALIDQHGVPATPEPEYSIVDSCWCGYQPLHTKAKPHEYGGDRCRHTTANGHRPPPPTTPGERWCKCKQQTIPQGRSHLDADGTRHRSTEGCRPAPEREAP